MRKLGVAFGLVTLGVLGRLIPHPPNATPITGIVIAARRELGAAWTYAIPLCAMLLSDLVIGFYSWKILVSVYGSFAIIALLSRFADRRAGIVRVFLTTAASSLLFFFITNAAVWIFSPWYEKSVAGLLYCLTLGLPFLRNMFLGDLVFVPLILYGGRVRNAFTRGMRGARGPRMQTALVSAVLFFIMTASLPFSAVADTGAAVSYLAAHLGSPWVSMALSASGENPDMTPLQSVTGSSAIDFEAPILAITASGSDPRTFGSEDLVAKLKSFYANEQIGDPSLLNDDVFGLLALASAGVSKDDAVVAGTRDTVVGNQNIDGGWGFQAGTSSDTNTTAAAVMALMASGSGSSEQAVQKALAYLHAVQNADGGFPYDPKSSWGTASDASSDAWIMMALSASGISESSWAAASGTPRDNLLSLRTSDGYFQYQADSGEDSFSPVTTSYAVIALSGKTLPVRSIVPPPPSDPTPVPEVPPPVSGGGGGGNGMIFTASPSLPALSGISAPSMGNREESTASATSSAVILEETPPMVGAVLGANTYVFDGTLRFGSFGDAVTELHKILIAGGYLKIKAPTGWFGPLTQAAVRTYQAAHDIPDTGLVGPLTRSALNSPVTYGAPPQAGAPDAPGLGIPIPEDASSGPEIASSSPPVPNPPMLTGGGSVSSKNAKPEITLAGDAEIRLPEGDSFTDPGATAVDAEDGDVSASIIVSGSVDVLMPGTYELNYSVTDSGGASDAKIRKVTVDAPAPLPHEEQAPNYTLPAPGENADLRMTSSNDADPKFVSIRITPLNVYVGDTQTLAVTLSSSASVTSVTATMVLDHQTVSFPLVKSAADPSGNTYQASWVVFDTHVATYRTEFTARNESGKENAATLAWSDPCAGITQGANSSLSANCSASAVSGLDGGNLTIPAGITLTLGSGAVWVWNPGTSVIVNGAVAISGTASAKKGYLFYSGSSNDSANTSSMVYGASPSMTGYVRSGTWFSFIPVYGSQLGAVNTSNTVTIGGVPSGTAVTLGSGGIGESGVAMSINGGSWVTSGTVNPGDTLAVKMRVGSDYLTTYEAYVTVAGASSTFSVTTKGSGGGCGDIPCP